MQPATVLVSIGTRPEAVKFAPLGHELNRRDGVRVRVLATAQYRELLDQILRFFGVEIDIDLDLMRENQGLAGLTGRTISKVDAVLTEEKPDFVFAQGDATTVMVTGLACYYRKIPMGHVEAGLRTGNKFFPVSRGDESQARGAPRRPALCPDGAGTSSVQICDALQTWLP